MSMHSGWENVIKSERERLGMDKPQEAPKVEAKPAPKPEPQQVEDNVVAMEKPKRGRPRKAPK